MSVIVKLEVPATQFELGRVLRLTGSTTVALETMVPLGETAVPFLSVHESTRDTFEEEVRDHPTVTRLERVDAEGERTLYAMDWDRERDLVFEGFAETGATLLDGKGTAETWSFDLRFPDHEALSAFKQWCEDSRIRLNVKRVYNPTRPTSGPWFGLTEPQRAALVRAVEAGYYSIPREMSTQELAEEFGISDQAVTERLRRAIVALVENTLVAAAEDRENREE
jgi:hypothetical protein